MNNIRNNNRLRWSFCLSREVSSEGGQFRGSCRVGLFHVGSFPVGLTRPYLSIVAQMNEKVKRIGWVLETGAWLVVEVDVWLGLELGVWPGCGYSDRVNQPSK